jgi:hypothetical protein
MPGQQTIVNNSSRLAASLSVLSLLSTIKRPSRFVSFRTFFFHQHQLFRSVDIQTDQNFVHHLPSSILQTQTQIQTPNPSHKISIPSQRCLPRLRRPMSPTLLRPPRRPSRRRKNSSSVSIPATHFMLRSLADVFLFIAWALITQMSSGGKLVGVNWEEVQAQIEAPTKHAA